MNTAEMVDWIAWAAIFLWALGKVLHIRRIMRAGDFPSPPQRLVSLALWVLLATFLVVDYPKVHIIWLAVLCELILRWGQIVFRWPFIPLIPITRAYAVLLAFDIPPPPRTDTDRIPGKPSEQPGTMDKRPPSA